MANVFAVPLTGMIAAQAEPEIPSIEDFLPEPILFQGTPFAINRIILIRIIATIVLIAVLGISAKRAKLVPGRWQALIETGIDFVKNNIVYAVMGQARGQRYVAMISTIFFTIFFFNLCSLVPGANIAATATVVMPLVFSIWVLIQYWIVAAREQGLWHYLKHEMFAPGVPWPVYILLAPIQLIELVLIRPASLTIRLFANMVSGHLIVATFIAFAQYWLVEYSHPAMGLPIGGLWFIGAILLTCFEGFVAFLQAYVFAILSTMYINLSFAENDEL